MLHYLSLIDNFESKIESMLTTRSLCFTYDNRTRFQFPDIDLDSGQQLLILGKSGVGKTTLLHLIAGLIRPESGSITLTGIVINSLSNKKLDKFRGNQIGLIFQRPYFVKTLSLQENLALVQYLAGAKANKERIMEVLDGLGIAHKFSERPNYMSQGEQQRAAIALAMVNHPKLILADEPTSSLDDQNCEKVANLLMKHAEITGAQLIIITHDQRLKAQFQNTLTL